MNILKWFTSKAGKLPVTVAQAAGLTAVVGAAGFAALSYLSAPADNTNTFIPPTQTEKVVFVSQNAGGGGYEANGEVGSSFKAAPSRSIQLANQQALREQQAQALDEAASSQPMYAPQEGGAELTMPKAADLGGADFNLGLGGNKDITGTFEVLSSAQNQLKGINDKINAQVNNASAATAGGANAPAGTPGGAADGKPATLASAARSWGKGTSGQSGGGSSNAFVIQDSNKNARGGAPAPGAEVGDALAQAQAAMQQMQEGTRMSSGRANFGRFNGNLADSRDATAGRPRRLQKMGNELKMVRKQSADIARSKTKSANEGAAPFLASASISGGLTVSGDNITIGQDSSSGDLNRADKSMRGIKAGLRAVGADLDNQQLIRDELKKWLLTEFTTALAGLIAIAVLVKAAKGPWAPVLLALAGLLAAALGTFIIWGSIKYITAYNGAVGSDGWTAFGWGLGTILLGAIPLAWIFGPGLLGTKVSTLTTILMPVLGFGSVGFGIADLASGDDSGAGEDVDGEEDGK